MSEEQLLLLATTAVLAITHTILGPDHYIPFIAISKARNWSNIKTLIITIFCGFGHILSSILIALAGVALGIAVTSLQFIEDVRGDIAGWLLIVFGLFYFLWGIKKSFKFKPHSHIHSHFDGGLFEHEHTHTHESEHTHLHTSEKKNITPWVLFIIFVFGPCEPLIPLLIYPAYRQNYFDVFLISLVFGSVTILTMVIITFMGLFGIKLIPLNKLERHIHALAGMTILICGIMVKILGL